MFKLLRYYMIASAVAVFAVTALVVVLIRQSTEETLVRLTEAENVALAQSILNATQDRVFSYLDITSAQSPAAILESGQVPAMNKELHQLAHGLNVLKIKIYALNGTTVFSSRPEEIGRSKKGYAGFEQALTRNKPASSLTFRGQFSTFEDTVFDRSLIATYVPITGRDGGIVGVFELYTDVSRIRRELDDKNIHIAVILGGVGALLWLLLLLVVARGDKILRHQYSALKGEIENRRMAHEELRKLAGTDPLTGAPNRRHFNELADQEVRHAHRYGHPVSALMIDLDDFKSINDSYGHGTGDHVLKVVSDAIHGALRGTDIMGRIGGDEFAVVLVEADIETAEFVADRIRATISLLDLHSSGTVLSIRASIGGAHARKDETLPVLLTRADEALYEAKEAGRDTVMFDQSQADVLPN